MLFAIFKYIIQLKQRGLRDKWIQFQHEETRKLILILIRLCLWTNRQYS